jgi:hypothetical protein
MRRLALALVLAAAVGLGPALAQAPGKWVIGRPFHLVSGDVQSAGLAGVQVHSDSHDAFELAEP